MGNDKGKSNLVKDGAVVASVKPLFGDVVLEMTDQDPIIYPARKNGGPTTPAFRFTLPINLIDGSTLSVVNTVYAELESDGGLKINVSLPSAQKGFRASRDLRDAGKAHINEAVANWPLLDKAMTDADNTFRNPPKKAQKADGKAEKSAAPLTWKPKTKPVVEQPAA